MLNLQGLEGLPPPGQGRVLSESPSDAEEEIPDLNFPTASTTHPGAGLGGHSHPKLVHAQSMQQDLLHLQKHYHKFYARLEVLEASDEQCLFLFASKRQPARVLKVLLNASVAFQVVEDEHASSLVGRRYESLEQLMSALDEADFGNLLCALAAAKLEEQGGEVGEGVEGEEEHE